MKQVLISIFATIILGSCSPAKVTGSPINDYMENIITGKEAKIIVIDKKIGNKRTLGIFKGDFMFSTKSNSYEREGRISHVFNKKDWEIMSGRYSYDTIPQNWERRDFKSPNVIIVKNEKFINGELYKEYNNKEYPVYSFSNPIIYQKQYMIFTVSNSNTTFGTTPIEFVVIMKRDNGKWVITDKVYEN